MSMELTDKLRFEMELEFVQLLSNPRYLKDLVQNRFLKDPAFQGYLRYLRYWKRPEYARYLNFPQSLFFLDMLNDPGFVAELSSNTDYWIECISQQQFFHWQHYIHNRLALAAQAVEQEDAGVEGEKQEVEDVGADTEGVKQNTKIARGEPAEHEEPEQSTPQTNTGVRGSARGRGGKRKR